MEPMKGDILDVSAHTPMYNPKGLPLQSGHPGTNSEEALHIMIKKVNCCNTYFHLLSGKIKFWRLRDILTSQDV